ncbi:hypothetical protein RFI_22668, partial [Reticulomyxa filosa]
REREKKKRIVNCATINFFVTLPKGTETFFEKLNLFLFFSFYIGSPLFFPLLILTHITFNQIVSFFIFFLFLVSLFPRCIVFHLKLGSFSCSFQYNCKNSESFTSQNSREHETTFLQQLTTFFQTSLYLYFLLELCEEKAHLKLKQKQVENDQTSDSDALQQAIQSLQQQTENEKKLQENYLLTKIALHNIITSRNHLDELIMQSKKFSLLKDVSRFSDANERRLLQFLDLEDLREICLTSKSWYCNYYRPKFLMQLTAIRLKRYCWEPQAPGTPASVVEASSKQ